MKNHRFWSEIEYTISRFRLIKKVLGNIGYPPTPLFPSPHEPLLL